MEDKEVIEILTQLMEKHALSEKEKEAVLNAIGILSWTKLGQARIKKIAEKKKEKRKENNF